MRSGWTLVRSHGAADAVRAGEQNGLEVNLGYIEGTGPDKGGGKYAVTVAIE